MRSWLLDFGPLVLAWMGVQVLLMCVLGMWVGWHGWQRRAGASVVRLVHATRPEPLVPRGRPVEQVAADVRRLRAAFGQEGMRFAKWEGTRRAYDGALAEAVESLGLEHRLALLPPGRDRDFERERIERMLEREGLLPPLRAA